MGEKHFCLEIQVHPFHTQGSRHANNGDRSLRMRRLGEFQDVQVKDEVNLNGDHVLVLYVCEKPPKQ
jgi:hypothetical protein